MVSYDMNYEIINVLGLLILGFSVFTGIYILWKQNIIIFSQKKEIRQENKKKEISFYCEACKTSNYSYLKTVNLAMEPPMLMRKCIRCEHTFNEEPFEWKHKKMILTDEWELAGMHRQTDMENQEQKIKETSKEFIEKKNEFPYRCNLCDMKFKVPVELRWHKVKIHPPEPDKSLEIQEDEEPKPKEPEPKPEQTGEVSSIEMPHKTLEDVENQDIPLYDDDYKDD